MMPLLKKVAIAQVYYHDDAARRTPLSIGNDFTKPM
jgi:hypothetical protein